MPKSNRATQERPASRCRQRRQHNELLGHGVGDEILAAHTRRDRDLLGKIISDFVLQVLSFVADSERESRRKRQAEGIAAAKAKGIRFGRKRGPLPKGFAEIHKQWSEGLISTSEAAQRCGIPRSSFRYRAMIFEKDASSVNTDCKQG